MRIVFYYPVLVLALISLVNVTCAQTYDHLDYNQIKAIVFSNGQLFNNTPEGCMPGYEVPQGMNTYTIFSANLWIAGLDNENKIRSFAPKFNQNYVNYFGPASDDCKSEEFRLTYDKVWKVDIAEILFHIDNFDKPGYEMPESFSTWPAEGNIHNGEALNLAPYYDYNQNGIYDPESGDFPLIKGDYAVYFIYKDTDEHYYLSQDDMGLEFHGMLYGFNSTIGSVFSETLFLNYQIINRSQTNYSDVYAGLWTDFDLGYVYDDVFGSDSVNQMMYVYNSNIEDGYGVEDVYAEDFYGSPAPVQAVMLLNSEVHAAVDPDYYSGAHPGILYDYDDAVTYNVLQGKSMNGVPYFNPFALENGDTVITTYNYSGYPENGTGWIAPYAEYGGDVRGLISAGPYTLNSGEKICLDFALPYARDLQGDNLSALSVLREKAGAILDFFEENDLGCDSYQTGILDRISKQDKITVYPNPSNGEFNVDLSDIAEKTKIVRIYSIEGKLLEEFTSTESELELSIQTKGSYLLFLETSKNKYVSKFEIF